MASVTPRTAAAGSARRKRHAVLAGSANTGPQLAGAPAASGGFDAPGAPSALGAPNAPGAPSTPASVRPAADPGHPSRREALPRAALQVAAHPLNLLRVATVTGPATTVEPAPMVASSPDAADHLVVAVHGRGVASFVRNGELLACGPQDVVVLDAATPFAFQEADDFVLHLVGVPRRLLGAAPATVNRLCGVHPHGRGAIASLLGPLLADVTATARDLPPRARGHLAGTVTGLLGALATETETETETPGDLPDTPTDHQALTSQLRTYVNERLSDDDLSPGGIAAHHHISTRLLHKLFATDGITVSRWIRQRRLHESRRELAAPHSGRPHPAVASIAKRWGFPNAAHFSRTFRSAYDVSPTAWRDLHVPPTVEPPGA
ncbi:MULTISPECIES: helix-turn-helix domain-containing protein [Streptomyces]|uniref:helix-turn-helix domain-containing protein n=1 Tax=Streptomyces TaxID=1883 RepID=UPI0021AEC899|nr:MULTISPECIES: helix-turn-helix domain-containing protein [Streptomyces]